MTTPVHPDYLRGQFLEKLHRSELLLSEWEQSFVASYVDSGRWSSWFTPARRIAADKLRMKFGGEPEIGLPLFADPKPTPRPEAAPGCCEFLKFDEHRRQLPCNAPAVWRRQNGFSYCEDCAETVRQNMKRMGRKINLVRCA